MEQDSRLCIKVDKTELANFSINRLNINIYNSIEVVNQVASFIRTKSPSGVIDSAAFWPEEPTNEPKICIVFNNELGKVQFSVIGLTDWEAATVCALVNHYFCSMLITQGENQGA